MDAELSQQSKSSGSERMKISRERRRKGLRCVTLQIRESEVDALIHLGHLQSVARNDVKAIQSAMYAYLDQTLRVS